VAKKAKKQREIVTLSCVDCNHRNYTATRNKRKHQDKLELSKYCRFCRKHTSHKEVR